MASKRTKEILEKLDQVYTREYKCYLNYETPEQLLVATMLSAQCTDARVNVVTKDLFKKYPDMEAFAKADLEELEQDIKPTGFYHNKAKNIIGCARKICLEFFHEPSVVVDTHVKRISRRLGLTKETDPEKIEQDLMKVLPKDHWILYNIQIITFGRQICFARSPKCEECFLINYCTEYKALHQRKKSGK